LTGIARDVKHAFRALSRSPGFSIIAVAVMALCLGAATSLFTIVRSVLLRPLPFRDPDRLVMVYEHHRGAGENAADFNYAPVAAADFYDWRAKTDGFEDMAIMGYGGYSLTGEGGELPESVRAAAGSCNLFPLLGVQPRWGRAFTEAEDQRGSTVVILTWSVQSSDQTKAPASARAGVFPKSAKYWAIFGLLLGRLGLGVLAAEALHAAGGVHQFLLAGEERMATRADFHADVALMGRAGHKVITARTVHTNFVIRRMNSCFHVGNYLDSNHLILSNLHRIQQTDERQATRSAPWPTVQLRFKSGTYSLLSRRTGGCHS
jgi:MacB-like periplasmic core domain